MAALCIFWSKVFSQVFASCYIILLSPTNQKTIHVKLLKVKLRKKWIFLIESTCLNISSMAYIWAIKISCKLSQLVLKLFMAYSTIKSLN